MRNGYFTANLLSKDTLATAAGQAKDRKLPSGVIMSMVSVNGGIVQTAQSYHFPKADYASKDDVAAWLEKRNIAYVGEVEDGDELPMNHNPNPIKAHSLRFNFTCKCKLVREEMLEGRKYIVAPAVIAKPGVMNNVLYTEAELSKFPEAWNGVPVTHGHPTDASGAPIQASTPTEWEKYKIGALFNTVYNNKLSTELWLDRAAAEEKAPAILKRILDGDPVEVSTGLFVDEIHESGTFDGKSYGKVAANYRPNHLAVLPSHEKGAEGWADGVGTPRVNKNLERITKMGGGKVKMRTIPPPKEEKNEPAVNVEGVSHDDVRKELSKLVENEQKGNPNAPYSYIDDVYDDCFVVNKGGKLYKRSYGVDEDGNLELGDGEAEVRRTATYEPIETPIVKTKEVKSNSKEDQPKKKEKGTMETNEKQENAVKPMTVDEVIKAAPAGVRELLANSLAIHNEEKKAKIETILANKAFAYTKEQLEAKDIQELKILANAAKIEAPAPAAAPASAPATDYGVAQIPAAPAANAKKEEEDEHSVPPMPKVDFSKK